MTLRWDSRVLILGGLLIMYHLVTLVVGIRISASLLELCIAEEGKVAEMLERSDVEICVFIICRMSVCLTKYDTHGVTLD